MGFDEESRALYDAVAPRHDDAYFQARLDRIASVLASLPPAPGGSEPAAGGSLRDRVEALRARVTIPHDRSAVVFDRAIAECRDRSAGYVALPAGEGFTVEQVTRQAVERLQLVPGRLPERHPGQRLVADLDRPRDRSRLS